MIKCLLFGGAVKKPSLFSLISLISLASVGAVLPSPALNEIALYYNIQTYQAEWITSAFVFGYALSQLFYGPFSNSFGRKSALYLGIGISIIGGVACIFASNFWTLVISRLITAFGSGCGFNLTITIINDYYREHIQSRKITAYAMSAFGLLPGISIFIGGEITSFLGWRSCFVLLALFSVFAFILVIFLPETHCAHQRIKFGFANTLHQYVAVCKNKMMYLYALIWGVSVAIVYIVSSTAPIIANQSLGLSAAKFGQIFTPVTLAYFVGTIIAAKLSARISVRQIFGLGCMISSIGALLLLVSVFLFPMHALLFFMPLMVVYLGLPKIFTTAASQVMKNVDDRSTTSSVVSFLVMMIAFMSSTSVEFIHQHLYFYIPVIIFIAMIVINLAVIMERFISR